MDGNRQESTSSHDIVVVEETLVEGTAAADRCDIQPRRGSIALGAGATFGPHEIKAAVLSTMRVSNVLQ
jgi:hypothetical protein